MKTTRYAEKQIISVLKEAEAALRPVGPRRAKAGVRSHHQPRSSEMTTRRLCPPRAHFRHVDLPVINALLQVLNSAPGLNRWS